MNIKLNDNNILHVIAGMGWYIDNNEVIDVKRLGESFINRSWEEKDVLNNPCIYVMPVCNGTCQYCYQNKNLSTSMPNLTYNDIKRFIEKLNCYQNGNINRTVELFGGEPLLRKDIKDIIMLLKENGYRVLIATNGTLPILRDSEFLKIIKENVHIRISLDGHTKELHEKYRTKNTFENIVNNVKTLRNENIDVSIKSIISDYNFPYIEDILYFVRDQLKVKHWNYNVLYKLDAYHDNGIVTNINHYDMVKELCKEKYSKFLPMFKQTPFTQMLTSVYVKQTKRYRRMYIFLNYDKKIYMNDQLIVPEYCMGDYNDFHYSVSNFIKKYETERDSCKKCFARDYCYLGNYGELYNKDTSLMNEFPTCDILRDTIRYLMTLRSKGIKILRNIYL